MMIANDNRLSWAARGAFAHLESRPEIVRELLDGNCLSWSARGLLFYMLEQKGPWQINVSDIASKDEASCFAQVQDIADELIQLLNTRQGNTGGAQ